MKNFDKAFDELLANEGGYVDNPNDPGGATKYGVTERVARAHGYQGDMHDLSVDDAKAIAKAAYWDAVKADLLPSPLDFQVFDAGYNSGPSQAIKWLQAAVGVPQDGILGPNTMAAAASFPVMSVVARFNANRLTFLTTLPTWTSFGKGWARRIANNLTKATI